MLLINNTRYTCKLASGEEALIAARYINKIVCLISKYKNNALHICHSHNCDFLYTHNFVHDFSLPYLLIEKY